MKVLELRVTVPENAVNPVDVQVVCVGCEQEVSGLLFRVNGVPSGRYDRVIPSWYLGDRCDGCEDEEEE